MAQVPGLGHVFLVIRPVHTGQWGTQAGQKKLVMQCFFAIRAVHPASVHR